MSTNAFSAKRRPTSGLGGAYAAFALLGLVWGSNFIFTKWAAALISPAQIVLLRVIFGFLPLLVVALATRSLSWRDWRHAHHFLVMSVLAMAFYYFAFAEGTALLLSSVAGMLSGAVPIFTFITALAILREEPINAKTIGGTVLVISFEARWRNNSRPSCSGMITSIRIKSGMKLVVRSLNFSGSCVAST